jgi:heme-degrading monooxygenase HmoA
MARPPKRCFMARQRDGFLGVESARDGLGVTVSYRRDENAARAWKHIAEHLIAQRKGRDSWYADYRVRVAAVVREYGLANSSLTEAAVWRSRGAEAGK